MIRSKQGKTEFRSLRSKLRNNMTYPERVMWKYLRSKQLNNLKFRRQHGIGNFIVDFFCPEKRLAIEIDGDTHASEVSTSPNPSLQRRGEKNNAFSLIEILVLVSLVGILYSLIFPSFNSINFSFQLLSLTKQIAADLKFTQQGAISSDFPYIITFKENSYNILSTQNGEEKILKSSIFPVGFSINTNFENNKLNFSIDGNPSRAGSIELSNSKGKTRKIYVSNIGRIRFE